MSDVLSELISYVREHTRIVGKDDEGPAVHDLHFIRVATDEAACDHDRFVELVDRCCGERAGEFGAFDRERLEGGPSYIEIGGWVGDQTMALRFMALGVAAEAWEIITPERLGIEGPDADRLAGGGFVMVSGYHRSKVRGG